MYNKDTPETLLRFLKRQRDKKIILWPFNLKFHFILIVVKMYDGEVEVFDLLSKEPILYKTAFDMLKEQRMANVHPGRFGWWMETEADMAFEQKMRETTIGD